MGRKIAAVHTQYYDESHTLHTLRIGDELPKGHEKFVKNSRVFKTEAGESTTEHTPPAPTDPPVDLKKLKKPELVALAAERGLPVEGNVNELRERLSAPDDEEEKDVDLADLDRAELLALATERGVGDDIDENTSDDEIVALIENT